MAIILSTFLRGYRGKTTDFALTSQHHRTTVAHFLNQGKWNDFLFQDALRNSVAYLIYREATISGQPIFCIVDDTIASHTKPSSQALHPIEAAYFHQSHLKVRQDYGHQIVSVMLSCNGITLNYAVLPIAPVVSYFLCDSWYTSAKVMDCFAKKRILHHRGFKNQPNPLSLRNPSESQCICPSLTENRAKHQPCDR